LTTKAWETTLTPSFTLLAKLFVVLFFIFCRTINKEVKNQKLQSKSEA
jgi:hypothetical protein